MRVVVAVLMFFFLLDAKEPPLWLKDPTMGGKYVAGVGCATKQPSLKMQKKMALLQAQGAIADSLSVEVDDTTELLEDFDEIELNATTQTKSSDIFTTSLLGSYTDENGELCVWLVKD